MTDTGSKIVREIAMLRLSEAEAFFSIVVHRSALGHAIPTITAITPGLGDEHANAMREHLGAMAETLRAAYAPRSKEGRA